MRADLKALADIVIQSVRATFAPLVKRLGELEAVVKALPEITAADLDQRITKAVEGLPKPKDGEPGTSVTPEDVAPLVADEVAKAVQALPVPKDGASVTLDDVRPLLDEAIKNLRADVDETLAEPLNHAEQARDALFKALGELRQPEDGKSVTPEDVAPMIAEEVAKAVQDIPAPKDGESVPLEQVRKMVDEEVAKAMGAISSPKDGEPGRDALQLELQPEIDQARTYARGTYAKHAGGLWRAFEATKGLHGWECVVDGIAELRVDQDGREFTLVARTSSGAEVSKSIKVAALVDKGVFKAGSDYEAGDGVTWGGSFFIAQKDAPIGHPGEPGSDGWRLAVKRGRDSTKGIAV